MKNSNLEKELLYTIERLAKYDLLWQKNNPRIIKVFEKVERKGSLKLTNKERLMLSEYFEMAFYEGKIMAYLYVMQELSRNKKWKVPEHLKYFSFWLRESCGFLPLLRKKVVPCSHIDEYFKKYGN